jgi:hypothetical protein
MSDSAILGGSSPYFLPFILLLCHLTYLTSGRLKINVQHLV